MSTYGDKLGRDGLMVGVGISVQPGTEPEPQDVIYNDFRAGVILSDSPEDIPGNSAQDAIDMEVSRSDALRRAPGSLLLVDVDPRSPRWLFEHAAVDYSAELVIIDPPYLGYRSTGAFIFANLALAATSSFGWNVVNVAGELIFSNGLDATYQRSPAAAVVVDLSADIIAQTFATSFGRVFAAAYMDSVSGFQGLGIAWNADNGDPADWAGTGSGAELLLSNNPEADRIVALRPIGFDVLGILTRRAVWFGYPTNQANRPADFRVRFPGLGCVAEATAVVTPHGIVYLSDDGVCLLDVNNLGVISEQINALLLPIDYLNISKYKGVYSSSGQRYVLQTSTQTFVYEFPREGVPGRWFVRSIIPDTMSSYIDQTGNVYWYEVQGTWAAQSLTWAEMIIGNENVETELLYAKGTRISRSTHEEVTYDGTAQTPYWTTPQRLEKVSDQATTLGFEVEYVTEEAATVEVATADVNGAILNTATVTLPNSSGIRKTGIFPFHETGKGAAVRFTVLTGSPLLYRARQIVMPGGPTLESLAVA